MGLGDALRKTREVYRLLDVSLGTEVARNVRRAASIWERLRGLIGRNALADGEGLWIDPCTGIHTFGMRFAIDLLVLDAEGRVLRMVTHLKPWRVTMPVTGGRSVVELAAGALEATSLKPGDLVRWERSAP